MKNICLIGWNNKMNHGVKSYNNNTPSGFLFFSFVCIYNNYIPSGFSFFRLRA